MYIKKKKSINFSGTDLLLNIYIKIKKFNYPHRTIKVAQSYFFFPSSNLIFAFCVLYKCKMEVTILSIGRLDKLSESHLYKMPFESKIIPPLIHHTIQQKKKKEKIQIPTGKHYSAHEYSRETFFIFFCINTEIIVGN